MKIINRIVLATTVALASTTISIPAAFADGDHLPEVAGVVKKLKSGKITIKHDEIPNLDMPGMTMVFRVDDESLTTDIGKGDNVMFTVEERDGKMYIVSIEKQ